MLRLVVLGVGFCGAALATLAARGFATRFGVVNHPNPIVPQHVKATPYLGGVGLAVGVFAALGAARALAPDLDTPWFILLPGFLFLSLGVADDMRPLRPLPKFALQAAAAATAVAAGVRGVWTGTAPLDAALSWLTIVTVVNAFNFTDVCDGLVGGLSVAAFAALGLQNPRLGVTAWATVAASVGFMLFNRPPATIFLGDAGSHFLGYLAAALAITARGGDRLATIAGCALALHVFLFELVFITSVRIRKGLAWWRGSPDHFSLRLQAAGLTRLQTNLVAWACGLASAIAGTMLPALGLIARVGVLLTWLAASAAAARVLLRWEVRRT